MKSLRLWFLVIGLALALPGSSLADASSPPMESTNYAITWSTLEETHGGQATSDNFTMETAVVGQMFAQSASLGGHYDLCTGFACLPGVNYRIYLPVILRK
jgi:hypothetical protein